MSRGPRPWRWIGVAVGVLTGVGDMALAHLLQVDFRAGARDVTWVIAGYLCGSFALVGYFAGLAVELRRRDVERTAQLGKLERLGVLGELSAALAHELRNPLALLRSSLQNFGEATPSLEPRVAPLISDVDRMTAVIRGVLNLAKPVELTHARAVPVRALFDRTRPVAEALLRRRIPFDSEAAATAEVHGDVELLGQLLIGLISNATEHSTADGSVRVLAERHSSTVRLAVEDRGPGVPTELRGKIFEPFVTTRADGMGLGLAVARRIVESHRGTIHVEDRPGGGARFVVDLPQEQR